MKKIFLLVFICYSSPLFSQVKLGKLTVEKIMRDPKWIGTSPSGVYYSSDGKYLFFGWNPENALSDSIYYITRSDRNPKKAPEQLRQATLTENNIRYNKKRSQITYSLEGDIFLKDLKTNRQKRITQTADFESNPVFVSNDTKIVYMLNQNLYAWDMVNGSTEQLSNFQRTLAPLNNAAINSQTGSSSTLERASYLNEQEKWLRDDQLGTFDVLKRRKKLRDETNAANSKLPVSKQLKSLYISNKQLSNVAISPDGRFITYRLSSSAVPSKNTIVPSYVTESGFTTDIQGRTKVGAPEPKSDLYIFDTVNDTVLLVKPDQIPGITDQPDYIKDYKRADSANSKKPRNVTIYGPFWNETASRAVVEVRSEDNKDRWIMLLDASKGKMKLLDRQRNEAWIGGPGISAILNRQLRWIDENTYWYQSEETGYSHLYKVNVNTGEKSLLTSGNYEVQQAVLSINKKFFYITTNEVHPGEQQFYRLPVSGGKAERITKMTGANQVTISADETEIAFLYSYMNKPWELYVQENKPGGKVTQITFKAQTEEFRSYAWKEPEIITFNARDGATVYARLYRPSQQSTFKPAVIFVHGAGYLQNAHKWWSQYFREYMFNNLLADNGYTVMDIDYRGSAGYGRDWRTGIYRHMGGKDLTDHVDAAKFMVEKLGIDPKRIGIYGGSYGGFITLMAMFKEPDVFKAGAGVRSVTDWAHYNHGYTSAILNEPFNDSLAYKRSSPIYFAEGLKGHLLMCHGMVDVNVHFQDIVRLTQRLIELGKDNWELAVYPMEDHAFIEPSSWTDEYKRIFKLFETTLKTPD